MDAPTPIKILFKKIRDGQICALKDRETISDKQLTQYEYDILIATYPLHIVVQEMEKPYTDYADMDGDSEYLYKSHKILHDKHHNSWCQVNCNISRKNQSYRYDGN